MTKAIAIFDVDGTITDSAPLITDCVRRTLTELGLPEQDSTQLQRWVGPPLFVSFRDFAGLSEDDIPQAIALYRQHYTSRMFDVPVFNGMRETLSTLSGAGIVLAVATSKIERLIGPIMKQLDLASFFTEIAGSREDEPLQTKTAVIADVLDRLEQRGFDTSQAVMIGDRYHDIDGGRENGLTTIGVTWAGTPVEEFSYADLIVNAPGELINVLLTQIAT